MIGIECYKECKVKQTLDFLKSKGRSFVDGLFDEIIVSADEIGFPVVITYEMNVGYFFGEYEEEKVDIVKLKDYIK